MSNTFIDGRRETTLSYLAGLLEGEGSFLRPPPSTPNQSAVALSMTDKDVVQRAALLLEAKYWTIGTRQKPHHKTAYLIHVRGGRAIEVMRALYPLMGARRQGQIAAACEARSLEAHRVPYATEVAEMVALKVAGLSPRELAVRYGIHVKSVYRLLRNAARADSDVLAQAARIAAAEEEINSAVSGDCDLAWLAGIIEGEGTIGRNGAIRVKMTDKDVVDRVASMFGGPSRLHPEPRHNWSACYAAVASGRRAEEILMQIMGALGERRRERASAALAERNSARSKRSDRNLEIVRRLQNGESGPSVARDHGMTHQNVYYIKKKYGNVAACPRGEGSACKAEYAGSNPAAAST